MDEIKSDVSGTAFVVNYSRSKMVNVSKDIYAKLWVTPETIDLWNGLSENVYPNDDLNLSLRNRFYLEHIQAFIKNNPNAVIADVASGFDDYPFLVNSNNKFIEFDLPNIIDFKKQKISEWEKDKVLPRRYVQYYGTDLTSDVQRAEFKNILKREISENPSLIIMEGLSYYLNSAILNDLFEIYSEVQTNGSIIAFDYWKPDAMTYPVMVKLRNYVESKFRVKQDFYLFDETYIRSIQNYNEIESKDIAELELDYSDTRIFQGRDNKIPVYFSLLVKK